MTIDQDLPRVSAHVATAAETTGGTLTAASPVASGKGDALSDLLLEIGDDLERLHLDELKLVHFLRFVIVPPKAEGGAPLLVFGSDFDGTPEEHVSELWRVCGPELQKIFAHCADAPALESAKDLSRYFEAHAVPTTAYYSGTRGRTAEQVRAEDRLQRAIAEYLDSERGRKEAEADPHGAVSRFVETNPKLQVNRSPEIEESLLSQALHGGGFWPVFIVAILILGLPVALFFGLVKLKEGKESEDTNDHEEAEQGELTILKNREDRRKLVQNQLTHLVEIKPGWFRMTTLKIVLWAIDFLARHYFNRGLLGGIPSIHYARWMILERDRRLLFFSNFDGSWESYLGAFVDQAAMGLTAVWSNTENYPKSSFLLWQGARDEESFKNWTRRHQLQTHVWYSAYPTLSVQNVNDNTKLRAGLRHPLEADALEDWLRTL